MKWPEFLKKAVKLPVIDTEILLAGVTDQVPIKVQISRWQKSGKLIQLKRSIYVLAEEYRKLPLREQFIASILKRPSYISLEKAFEYHGLIPEAVPVYTSVTTKHPAAFKSKVGVFSYRQIKKTLFWGYEPIIIDKQAAFMASPEKALLDYFYLKGRKISEGQIEEMRLQNVEKVGTKKLLEYAKKFKSPSMLNTAS